MTFYCEFERKNDFQEYHLNQSSKIRFCDSGCQVIKSSIKFAKVLVFVSINDWNTFDEGAKIAIHSN